MVITIAMGMAMAIAMGMVMVVAHLRELFRRNTPLLDRRSDRWRDTRDTCTLGERKIGEEIGR